MTDKLLPCPFCGGQAELVEGEECAYVQCLDMKMHRAMFVDGDNTAGLEALEQWNRRAALAAAPQSAPDREALVEVIEEAIDEHWPQRYAGGIADALLARGLRLPSGEAKPRRCAECDCEGGEYECTWIKPGPDRDNALQQLADLGQQADRASETMAWAVLGEDRKMVAINYDRMTAQHLCNPGERIERVAIRVVEGGDDA